MGETANRSMFLSHIDVSLSLHLSLKSINISSGEDQKNESIPCYLNLLGNESLDRKLGE